MPPFYQMKKGEMMKKITAFALSLILIVSLMTFPAHASNMEIEIDGIKTEKETIYLVDVSNTEDESKTFKVHVANFNSDATLKNVKTYKETVDAQTETVFSYHGEKNSEIYIWEDFLRPLRPSFTSDDCESASLGEEIKINYTSEDVFASYEPESQNNAGMIADGDVDTVWTVKDIDGEKGENATIFLGDDYILSKIGIAFGLGEEREYIFSVDSSEDGENFKTIIQKGKSEKTNDITYINLPPVRAKYVRLNIFGRSDNGAWCRISEVETYGYRDSLGSCLMENVQDWDIAPMDEMTYTDYEPKLGEKLYAEEKNGLHIYDDVGRDVLKKVEINSVAASQTPESENHHNNTIDSDLSTIWTAKDVSDKNTAHLVADLGEEMYISRVGIGFDKGSERGYTFGIEISTDGKNYEQVLGKTEAAKTNNVQYFDIETAKARYIKYKFYQRTDSSAGWIRISEIEAYGGEEPFGGAGGILAQKKLNIPQDRQDYKISFSLNLTGNVYYSGIALTDGIITGGADLDNYAAFQLKFDNDGNKFKINRITSNYFNEGKPIELFEKSFNKGENVDFTISVSPSERSLLVRVADSETEETQKFYFSNADDELTRNTTWDYLEANTFVLNTGAGAKCEMTLSDFTLRQIKRTEYADTNESPANGIIRLEAVRGEDYPTSSGDYYGRYVYHSGEDNALKVAADKNPAFTRFVERKGLIGTGVSLEAANLPGYYVVNEDGAFYLKKIEHTGSFYANATFVKMNVESAGYYPYKTYSYKTYLDINREEKFLYDTTSDKKTGDLKPWKKWNEAQGQFYVKSEAKEYVADNFYGNSISSQWWTNYPWKANNPTNSSYNHSGLITKNNVVVENGELLLKATKASGWPKDASGETGINYNKWGKSWEKWKGYVGVVSIQNKVYNKNCFVEGSFKQPESPIGYWNAFWLSGRDSWPPEIDIFETLSSSYGAKAWHTAIHGKGDTNNLFGKSSKDNINITTGYHTFSMDWGYDYIKFFVDGKMYQRTHNNDTLSFQKNLRLILNTGLGGWEAEPDDTMVWNDGLRCKWVRTFQY